MRRTAAFFTVLAVTLLTTQAAFAVAFWATEVTPGSPMSDKAAAQYDWPKGTLAVVNHGSRHYGWSFFFSECPNDVRSFGYTFENTRQANELIARYAAIEGAPLLLTLAPGPGPAVDVKKDVTCDAKLVVGSQALMDQWYAGLGTKKIGGVTVRVWGVHTYTSVPKAQTPQLYLHVDGERVRLEDLKLPADLPVAAFPAPDDADAELRAPFDALRKLAEKHEAGRREREERAAERESEGS